MPNAPPPAALAQALRLSRATRRAAHLDLSGESTNAALDRLGVTTERHLRAMPGSRTLRRGGRTLLARVRDVRRVNVLVRALDAGVPEAAAARLAVASWGIDRDSPLLSSVALLLAPVLLAACVAPEVEVTTEPTPPPEVYAAEADATTTAKVTEVHAEARCEAGDVVLGGGCSWGARRAPAQAYPLEVIEDRPSEDGAGWVCTGQQDGVGVELEVLRASAVCLAQGGVS